MIVDEEKVTNVCRCAQRERKVLLCPCLTIQGQKTFGKWWLIPTFYRPSRLVSRPHKRPKEDAFPSRARESHCSLQASFCSILSSSLSSSLQGTKITIQACFSVESAVLDTKCSKQAGSMSPNRHSRVHHLPSLDGSIFRTIGTWP